MTNKDRAKITKLAIMEVDQSWEPETIENVPVLDQPAYELNHVITRELGFTPLPFDIRPGEYALPILEMNKINANGRSYVGYKNVGFIPHVVTGDVVSLKAMVNMAVHKLMETTPDLLDGVDRRSFAIRSLDGDLLSFDYVKDPVTNSGAVEMPPLELGVGSRHLDCRIDDEAFTAMNDTSHSLLRYNIQGGFYKALNDAFGRWHDKNRPGYEEGKRTKKDNVKAAKKSVSGISTAGALFKSLLGNKK